MTLNKTALPLETITSDQNSKYKVWLSLTEAKGIKKNRLALLSGEKLIQEYVKQKLPVESEIISIRGTSCLPLGSKKTFALKPELFKTVDINATNFSVLVIPLPEFEESRFGKPQGIEVIAPLQDPRNLGALIRSCAAFGIQKIHLPPVACHPYHPKCLKVAAGGFMHVKFERCPQIDDQFAEQVGLEKAQLYFLDSQGTSLRHFKRPKDLYLAVGEEGQGLPDNLRNRSQAISIPTTNVESLNATVAMSIALYALTNSPSS